MKKVVLFLAVILVITVQVYSQVGVNQDGANPDPSAILDAKSTTKGFLPPRMTTNQRDAISSPAVGLIIYNTECNDVQYFNGADWIPLGNTNTGNSLGTINGNTSPCAYSAGVIYSVTPVSWAKGYNWTVPGDAIITSGQGTATITVTFGSIDGVVCVSAYGNCWRGLGSCLDISLTAWPMSPTPGNHITSQTQIVWNWNSVPGATGYKWNTVNDFNTAQDLGTATTKTETGLACNNTYSRYVWAYNVCASLPSTLTKTTTECMPSNCLVGFWPFNGNVNDESGNGNNGVNNGCSLTTDRFGNNNSAYSFNGSSDFIHVPNSSSLNINGNTSLTICAWATTTISSTQGIFVKWGPGGEIDDQYVLGTQNGKYVFGLSDEPTFNYTNSNVVNNQWIFISGVYDYSAGISKIFINGNLNNSMPLNFSIWNTQQDVEIGRWATGNHFIGKIDDIRIYNCALTDSQIAELYNENNSLPVLTTTAVTTISQTSAVSGGNISASGGSTVTARGVCWSTSSNPTISGSHTADGTGIGTFTSTITGLTSNTTYYIRAYATNSVGTAYGNQISCTTATGFTCGASSIVVNHIAGLVAPINKLVTYQTVTNVPGEINKCWITSNLGSDHQATAKDDATEASAGWYYQFNRKQGYKHDGTSVLPSWNITSINENSDWLLSNDPCKIELGSEWRIPTYSEWENVDAEGAWTNWNGPWNSNLKLHAAGKLAYSSGSLTERGVNGYYWSSRQISEPLAWYLNFNAGASLTTTDYKSYGFSIRCLSNIPGTFYIGQNYGGGIIFYIDPTGQHGLISAPSDQATTQWGCFGTTIGGTVAAIGSGSVNTTAIINGCSTIGIAARICYDLVLNGYDDWYMPSKDELNQMFIQKNVIGGFSNADYMSSTENDAITFWRQNFFSGLQAGSYKDYAGFKVRAIRAF